MIKLGKKYLITTSEWFYGLDGDAYRAAWGEARIETVEKVFGFSPKRPSTNWYLVVGNGEGEIIIAGCQIYYAILCPVRPALKGRKYIDKDTGLETFENKIYFAQ